MNYGTAGLNIDRQLKMPPQQQQAGRPDRIAIHCQGSRFGSPGNTAEAIDDYHVTQRGYNGGGYNLVIEESGKLVLMRHIGARGAHCPEGGYNAFGIGICLCGGLDSRGQPSDDYTEAQWRVLKETVQALVNEFGIEWDNVRGHRDILKEYGGAPKACPCFDVQEWLVSSGLRQISDDDSCSRGSNVLVPQSYVVQPGDGLWRIANKTGVPMSKIMEINGIGPNHMLHPGDVLKLWREQ